MCRATSPTRHDPQSVQWIRHGAANRTPEPAMKRRAACELVEQSLSADSPQWNLRRSKTLPAPSVSTRPSPPKRSGSIRSLRRSSSNLLADSMRHSLATLKRSSSRKLSSTSLKSFAKRNSNKELSSLTATSHQRVQERDLEFFEMIKHDPLDPEEASRYNDTAVRKYVRRHPQALRVQYDFPVGSRRLVVRRYPLSALVALNASLATIKLAIKACPAALEAASEFSSTALHAACATGSPSLEVVEYIYQKYPAAIKETTKLVFLPLHNACQAVHPSLTLVQFLVREYPEGLMAMNKLGDTPLRTAQRNATISPEVLDLLQRETTRVFALEENSETFQQVTERQSWGSKELKESLCSMAAELAALEDDDDDEHDANSLLPPSA